MASTRNVLLKHLVAADAQPVKGQMTFEAALKVMDVTSVFDIVRLSRPDFIRQLALHSNANGAQAYDNAMAYASVLARLYREHRTSSGASHPLAQRDGVRALVPYGPTYANLFKENWSEFCKVGALAANNSPGAYLSALRVFIKQLENTSSDTSRLLLDRRRPDLKELLITHESTFTPRPMLEIVNQVLGANLRQYLQRVPADQNKTVHTVLTERQYPFELPYNYYHQQCLLGLAGNKPRLGELSYQISDRLPIEQNAFNHYGAVQHPSMRAQQLLNGLSPQQQALLIAASPFSHFYLNRTHLVAGWKSPANCHLSPHAPFPMAYLLPTGQPDVGVITPALNVPVLAASGSNNVPLTFRKPGQTSTHTATIQFANATPDNTTLYRFNSLQQASQASLCVNFKAVGTLPVPTATGYTATFDTLMATGTIAAPVNTARRRFTLSLDEQYQANAQEKAYFLSLYGIEISGANAGTLTDLNIFMQHTQLHAEQVEMLLSRRTYAVRLSPNCPSKNLQHLGLRGNSDCPFPHANHYGACYVNGQGTDGSEPGSTDLSRRRNQFDNAMDLVQEEVGDGKTWHLTKTSLDRFDRLQRMIRLQRWTGIAFCKLDTLVVSAMRAEGKENLDLQLNDNTLRALGVYRHLNQRHGIDPQEFAAFMHYLTPYTTVRDELALFDQVFNAVQLFDTPLVLDHGVFTVTDTAYAARKTVLQLCAGLGLKPTDDEFLLIAAHTRSLLGSLKRDLATVSSLYRQARIARLFGCTVAQLLTLAGLLGGQPFRTALASGALRAPANVHTPDILDVLMQLQWAFDWLADSHQTIAQLQQRLGAPVPLVHIHGATQDTAPTPSAEPEPVTDDMRARLNTLQADTVRSAVTAAEVKALNLPAYNTDNAPMDWLALLNGAHILDAAGLLPGLDRELTLVDEPQVWLSRSLDTLLAAQKLSDAAKQSSKQQLLALLLNAHDRQTQLLADLFQEVAQLPAERAVAVINWAKTSVYAVLLDAQDNDNALIEQVQRITRHAEIVVQLRLSNRALRLFVCNPEWLGDYSLTNSEPSLADLYLFERLSHWLYAQDKPEDTLLSYFSLANPVLKRPTKKIRQQLANDANLELARLLGWSTEEVAVLTARLPDAIAKSMAQVDWVRRCQAACKASGLSAKALLQATALQVDSSLDDWKMLGDAVTAANTQMQA